MLGLRKIAITGGTASGKSTVCRLLKDCGSYVVDSDAIVHDLLSSHQNIREQVINLLGTSVVKHGKLDRKAIADAVFPHPQTLKALESILHPAVFDEIRRQYETIKDDPRYELFIVEMPLLYETGSASFFDTIVVVLAEEKLCRQRFITQKKGSERSFDKRMQRQMLPCEKAKKADFVFMNNDNLDCLEKQVQQFLQKLRST